MGALIPRLDALPEAQRRLWPSLQPALDLKFVLYGGTAISLRLGHRESADSDFFTDRPLDRSALDTRLSWFKVAHVIQDAPDTVTVLATVADAGGQALPAVKVSFFGGIRFGRLADPAVTDDGVAQVASTHDLLATKLKALLQRVEAKDYLDIAALLDSGVSLSAGLAGASALYGPAFQPSECLKALVYFRGGDLDGLSTTTRAALMRAVSTVGPLAPVTVVSQTLAL